jgi:hypothetical protein
MGLGRAASAARPSVITEASISIRTKRLVLSDRKTLV